VEVTISSSQGQAESRVFICPHCEQPVLAYVCGLAIWDGWDRDPPILDGPPAEYALLKCRTCDGISVQVREDYGDGGFGGDNNPTIVYPAQRQLSWEVPEPLRHEFAEAQACFGAKAYEATVVMVRRVLEGACRENGVQERTLVKSLGKLKADGLIDTTIAEWADALRILGNEGAHYTGKQVSRDDAEDALAFAEALLDHIYVLKKRFERFANRRASKRSVGK
jgi:hypothetical protein